MKRSYTNHVSEEARKEWEERQKLDPKKRVCHECAARAGTVNVNGANGAAQGEKEDGGDGGRAGAGGNGGTPHGGGKGGGK